MVMEAIIQDEGNEFFYQKGRIEQEMISKKSGKLVSYFRRQLNRNESEIE